jgi:NADH dehydrogenase
VKVFLTGSTGFVGKEILRLLQREGYIVVALVRDIDKAEEMENVIYVKGDILKPESYEDYLKECNAVIHLVGIIREDRKKRVTFDKLHYEATKNIVDLAYKYSIKRFIHMSANGTREDAVSDYHKTKFMAEEYLKIKGLNYTIFRPSVIYGPGDIFINMLNGLMKMTPLFSYFGDGGYKMQPVSVYEVAELFVNALKEDASIGKTYSVCGKDIYTYKEILKMINRVTGRKVLLFPIPEFIIRIMVKLFGKTTWFPITTDQFIMLTEGNICDDDACFKELNVKKRDMSEVLSTYLK